MAKETANLAPPISRFRFLEFMVLVTGRGSHLGVWVGVEALLTIYGAVDSVQDRRAGRGKTCCLWLFRHPAYWGISSVGRASGWQPEGQGFKSPILHFLLSTPRHGPGFFFCEEGVLMVG